MKLHYSSLFVILFFISISVSAQYTPEIDSLIKVVNTQKKDTLKINNLNTISWKLKTKDFDKAVSYANTAFDLSVELKFKKGQATAKKNLGGIHYLNGKYADAYQYYSESLIVFKELGDKEGTSKVIRNLGSIFHQQGEYDKALDYFFQSLEIRIELDDKKGIAKLYNGIGLVYSSQGEKNYDNALEYYQKALKISEELEDKKGVAASYNRIANVYTKYTQPKNEEALVFLLKVLELGKEVRDDRLLAQANQMIGQIYESENQNKKALEFYLNALKIWEEQGNDFGVGTTYNSISNYYLKIGKYSDAEKYALKSLYISKQINSPAIKKTAYLYLSIAYNQMNNLKKALDYTQKFYILKDSLQSEDMENAITTLSVQNQFSSQIKEQKLESEKKEIEHIAKEKRARILMFVFLAGLIFMVIFAISIFRSLKNKQRANKMLEEKNTEINAQKDEIQKHHDIVVHQKEEILASISYAEKIQKAVLPSTEYADEIFNNYFILFKPRDIVSGDFYWIKKIQNFTAIVAADSTGHGVPGAFMSMLGSTFLSALITSENIDNTAKILNKLRYNIKKSLRQTGNSGEQKDGMDLALYIINNEKNTLQFSGAYNPLLVVRNKKIENIKQKISENKKFKILSNKEYPNQTLIELKADRQPIGIYLKEKDFTNTTIQLEKGDKLYTFSDGFVDQFGGEKGRKYKTKNFKTLLLSIYENSMKKQKEILETTFKNWISHLKENGQPHEQIDDIIIIGIEIE